MPNDTNRRDFIRDAAAISFIFGWPLFDDASAGETTQVGPPRPTMRENWNRARTQMRDDVRPGLVIIVPENTQVRQVLANDLGVLFGGHSVARQVAFQLPPTTPRSRGLDRLFSTVVFVCLPAAFARTVFPNMPERTALVLVDHRGNAIDYQAHDSDLFQRRTVRRLTTFLHGRENRHLRAFVQAQRTAIGERQSGEVDQAINNLDSRVFRTRQTAIASLAAHLSAITVILAFARTQADSLEVQRRLDELLANAVRPRGTFDFEPLPYGVSWRHQQFDPCPFCGAVAAPEASRQFLRLLRFSPQNGQ